MNCPLCDNRAPLVIGNPITSRKAAHFIRQDYKVVKCIQCEFYFVDPKIDLSIEEWAQLYGNEYFLSLNNWYKSQRINDVQLRLKKMSKICNGSKINFLDLGCGEGIALIEALQNNWNTYGSDISDNRVDDAKQKGIIFSQGDLFSAGYPNDFFDIIHMDSVLEHVINPTNYLEELYRIMKKNAVIYIGVPNEDSLFDNLRQLIFKYFRRSSLSAKIRPFETPFHINGFTKKSLHIIAKLTGFEIVEIKNFATHFEYKKYPFLSRGFLIHFLSLPIDIAAIPLKMEKYFAVYLRKN